ncbi:MAG: tRNA (adenosine(37)-N6)-threonylcarbamoyltransferase complex ATPase subunit type 1 TsaE [Planctomycetota bacterium]
MAGTRFISNSAGETRALGAALARALPDGTVVALAGELGSGKTTFVQGAAEGLGIERGPDEAGETEGVTSPTFVLVREHVGSAGRVLVHVDAYRLRAAEELRELGIGDLMGGNALAFVEWADRVAEALVRPYLLVRFGHESQSSRALEVDGVGEGAGPLLETAARALAGAAGAAGAEDTREGTSA